MKKCFLFLCMILVFLMTGCNQELPWTNEINSEEKQDIVINNENEYVFSNEILPIYNIKNEKVDEINHYGNIIQTNDSIIYAKIPSETANSITSMDYYRYVIASKENIKLGTVNEWAQQSNEAVFLNNHLYVLILTGNINSRETRTLKLIDFNLENNTMSELFSEVGGFPFNSMVAFGDKLLIAKVLQNGSCVQEYNIKTKQFNTLISFEFNDETAVGETIRQIDIDSNTISLLMLVKETAESVQLRVDVYDYSMEFLHSINISGISSDINELKQGVSNFEYSKGHLYYENFSLTRFLGQIEGNTTKSQLTTNATFAMATETTDNLVAKIFYQSYSQGNNSIYLFNPNDSTIKKAEFYADDKRYYIINMSCDENNNLLLVMYYRDSDTGELLPPRLYNINISDLNFS